MKFEQPVACTGDIDPQTGMLCFTTYLRPAEISETVWGEKVQTSSFIPLAADELCLCGSGKRFGECCQPRDFWPMVCANPGVPPEAGYSFVRPHILIFADVDGAAIRAVLEDDERFINTEDAPARAFWVYLGDPIVEARYGWICFGDVELVQDRKLIVTAMSDVRKDVLLEVLGTLEGVTLGKPRVRRKPISGIDKRTGKQAASATLSGPRRRRRR